MSRLSILYGMLAGAGTFLILQALRKLYNSTSKEIQKKTLFDLIGNTPILYLKSLSQMTGCEIYVN